MNLSSAASENLVTHLGWIQQQLQNMQPLRDAPQKARAFIAVSDFKRSAQSQNTSHPMHN